ncbi:MAG: hypothetical protein AAF799_17790 [Myxococcota bacterium]
MSLSSIAYRFVLVGSIAGATACSPPSLYVEEVGHDIVLSEFDPPARFRVTLCMDGPGDERVTATASVLGDVVRRRGTGEGSIWMTIDGDEDGLQRQAIDTVSDRSTGLHFELPADGPWGGQSGSRCSTPQILYFDRDVTDWSLEFTMQWSIGFTIEYDDLPSHRDPPSNTLSIEMENGTWQ